MKSYFIGTGRTHLGERTHSPNRTHLAEPILMKEPIPLLGSYNGNAQEHTVGNNGRRPFHSTKLCKNELCKNRGS